MELLKRIKISYSIKISLVIISFLELSFYSKGESTIDDLSGYELFSVHSNAYFFNAEIIQNKILVGSNVGIFEVINPNKLLLNDKLKTGYVYLENGKIISLPYMKIGSATPQFKNLLPESFRNLAITGCKLNDLITIISKGRLFIYKKTIRLKADSLSIRSISKNYLGSYNGIFFKNKKIPQHTYTNGFIREYESEAFICFDGLTRISSNKMEIIETDEDWRNKIGIKNIETLRDIIKLKDNSYLLFFLNGIISSNLKGSSNWVFKNNFAGEPKFISIHEKADSKLPYEIIFIQKNKVYEYNIFNKKVKQILELDPNFGDIFDIAYEDLGKLYLITKDKLIVSRLNSKKNYDFTVLESNLIDNHNLLWLDEFVLITSNTGLSAFNVYSNDFKRNVILDEFNDKAYYQTGDSTFLGTPHGYYSLSNNFLKSLIINSNSFENDEELPDLKSFKIHFYITLILLVGALIFIVFRNKHSKKDENLNVISKEKIIEYIDLNLSKVTVYSISEHFNTNLNTINNELGNIKIGQLIRQRRLEIVRKMRKQLRSEESISIITGFSMSYLKKIK